LILTLRFIIHTGNSWLQLCLRYIRKKHSEHPANRIHSTTQAWSISLLMTFSCSHPIGIDLFWIESSLNFLLASGLPFLQPNKFRKYTFSIGYKSFNNSLPNDNLSTPPVCSYVIWTRESKKEVNRSFFLFAYALKRIVAKNLKRKNAKKAKKREANTWSEQANLMWNGSLFAYYSLWSKKNF
jgi:hypothetical protein